MADLPKGDAAFSPKRNPPARQPRRSPHVLERDGDSIRPESFMLDIQRFIKNLFREGNHQRGLDADKLDGYHASAFQLQDDLLDALAANGGTGLLALTGADTFSLRTITAGTGITVNNGNGVSANPEIVCTVTVPSAASTTEVLTGTDATKYVTPDSLAALWEYGGTIASAGTISVGEGGYFIITGNTTITDIDFATDAAGRVAVFVFSGASKLTYNATTLKLPTGADITPAAGDTAAFVSLGADAVRCIWYQRADGTSLAGGAGTVTNAANLTDNAVVRGDGGAVGVQTSGVIIDDSDNVSGVNNFTTTGETTLGPSSVTLTNASEHDYTGFNGATVWVVTETTSDCSVTGLTGGAAGEVKYLYSPATNTYNINLINQAGASSAGNRINTGTGADFPVTPGTGVFLVYANSEWTVKGCADRIVSFVTGADPTHTAPYGSLVLRVDESRLFIQTAKPTGNTWSPQATEADLAGYQPAGSYQPGDATLTALAGNNWAANAMPLGTGADTMSQLALAANTFPARSSAGNVVAKTITDFGLSLVDDADAAAARTTLSLVIGTNVQAWDADLDALAALAATAGMLSRTGAGAFAVRTLTADTGAKAGVSISNGTGASANPTIGVDITGQTGLTAPAVDDELLIYDLSATTNKKITTTDLLETLNVLTADATPDSAADYVMTYDASASTVKKVLISNLPSSGTFDINGLGGGVSPAAGDFVPFYDVSGAANKKITMDDLLYAWAALAATDLVPDTDLLTIRDVSANTPKIITAHDLLSFGRVSLNTNVTSTSTTLADTTLSVTVASGKCYIFDAYLVVEQSGSGVGVKIDFDGTATMTRFGVSMNQWNGTGGTVATVTDNSSEATDIVFTMPGGGGTGQQLVHIMGSFVVNAGGTFLIRFARNSASGTATLYNNSWLRVEPANSV